MKLFGVKEKHVFLSSFKHHYSTFLEKSLKIVIFHQLAHMTNNLKWFAMRLKV